MFNRIRKNFRGNEGGDAPRPQTNSGNVAVEQTGFICPMCMVNLPSPEALQSHFDVSHPVADPPVPTTQQQSQNYNLTHEQKTQNDLPNTQKSHSPVVSSDSSPAHQHQTHVTQNDGLQNGFKPENGVGNNSEVSHVTVGSGGVDVSILQGELEDLKASLNEEKWYSQELNKEMEVIKGDKLKLTSELEVVTQQMKIAVATNEELAKQKQTLEQKAAASAQIAADAKASADIAVSEKAEAEERSQNQSVELEKAATWIRDLESQLIQRPGADDVMVLKKELVQVQTLMDQMTLETEKKNEQVEQEREKLQTLLNEARSKAQLVQEEFDQFKAENMRLRMENVQTAAAKDESTKLYQQQKEELQNIHNENELKRQEEVNLLRDELDRLKALNNTLQIESQIKIEEKLGLNTEVERLKEELKQQNADATAFSSKYTELQLQIESANHAKMSIEEKLKSMTEEYERHKSKAENSAAEKETRIGSLTSEKDEIQLKLREAQTLVDQLKHKSDQFESRCNELQSLNRDLESGSSSARHQLEIELAQLKIKFEATETDNQQLLQQTKVLTSNLSEEKQNFEEERKETQAKLLNAEHQLVELKLQKTQLEEEVKSKQRSLEANEERLEEVRKEAEDGGNKIHSLNTENSLRLQEIEGLNERLSTSQSKLDDETARRETAVEEAKKLREERGHLIAQMEAGEGEAVARVQLAEENEALRLGKEEAEQKLREQSSEHQTSIRELSNKISDVSSRLATAEETLRSSEQQVAKLKESLGAEKEKLLQTEADLKAKGELLLSAQAANVTQRADIENHLQTVQRSLDDKMKELQRTSDELQTANTHLQNQKTQMNQLKQDHSVEVADLRGSLDKLDAEKNNVTSEVERWKTELEHEKEVARKEAERRKEELVAIESRHTEKVELLKASLKESKERYDDLSLKLNKEETERGNVDDQLNQTRIELENAKTSLQNLSSNHETTLQQLSEVKNTLLATQSELGMELESRKNEVSSSKRVLESLNLKLEEARQEAKRNLAQHEEEKQSLQKQVEEESSARSQAERESRDTATLLSERQNEVEALKKSQAEMTLRNEEEQNKLSSEICAHLATVAQLEERLEMLKTDVIGREVDAKRHAQDASNIKESLEKTTSELETTRMDVKTAQLELELTISKLESLQEEMSELKKQNSSLGESKLDVEKELNEKVEYIQLLETELEEKGREFDFTEEKLTSVKEQLKSSEQEKNARLAEWKQHRENLKSHIKAMTEEKDAVLNDLMAERESREQEVSWMKKEQENLQEEKKKLEENNKAEKKTLEERITSLELTQKKLETQKEELELMTEKLEQTLATTKEQHTKAQEGFEADLEKQTEKYKIAQSSLEQKCREMETAEAERVVSESRLQLEVQALSENLSTVRAEWLTTTQKLDAADHEKADLRGKIVQMETAEQSNADERRALLERCLNAEQQVEQLRGKVNEIQRRLEDAHSAMHELGRENQALQVKHTTTISRQWTDDRHAPNCNACSRDFTLTVRRHHCRHCGGVFCSECSSRTATVAASKNPVRVCERCFDELLVAG